MNKEENPPKYVYATDLIQKVMVKATKHYTVHSIRFLTDRVVEFIYIKDAYFKTKTFSSLKGLNSFLESLETYQVGDRIKCGDSTYLICADKGVFLVNLETGRTYGCKVEGVNYQNMSRNEVEEMFNYHSGVEFVKVN